MRRPPRRSHARLRGSATTAVVRRCGPGARATLAHSQHASFATEPVDMRGGFDRLAGQVVQAGLNRSAAHLLVFA